jgi:hypothetical protein
MVVSGIGGGIVGFGKNLAKGNVGDAFKALIRGIDKGTFGAVLHVGNGLIDAGQKLCAAPTYLLPFIGKGIREYAIGRAGDMIHTAFNTAVEVGRDMWRMMPETVLGMGTDLYQSAKALVHGDIKGALVKFGMTFVNIRARVYGGIVDSGARIAQGIVSIASTALGIEGPGRHLTAEEKALLRKVYGDSIDYDAVRIKHGGLSNLMAPHTVGNTIYLPDRFFKNMYDANGNLTELGARVLTHEMGHVWQSQNGGGDYIHQSLWEQALGIGAGKGRGAAYRWRSDVDANVPFDQLNIEQQADVFAEVGVALFRDMHGGDNDGTADIWEFNIDEDHDATTAEAGPTIAEWSYMLRAARHARRGEWS